MKRFCKLICCLLSIIFCATALVACGDSDDSGEQGGENNNPQSNNPISLSDYTYENGIHSFNVSNTSDYLIKDGTSQYKIIMSRDAVSDVAKAADFLNEKIKLATDVKLSFSYIEDINYTADSQYIVLGYNQQLFSKAGIEYDESKLRSDGFKITTKDKSIFIYSRLPRGVYFGAIEFLHQILNYEFYAENCEYMDTNVSNIPLQNYDITDLPDFEYRYNGYKISQRVYGYRDSSDVIATLAGSQFHNSFNCVPPTTYFAEHPDWYATSGDQLCYTARGNAEELAALKNVFVDQIKADLNKNKEAEAITLTHEDVGGWCSCEECKKIIDKYNGAKSATIILFSKDVAREIEEWLKTEQPGRKVQIIFFAYGPTIQAPAKLVDGKYVPIDDDVKLLDNMGVLYAPINANYQYTFRDDINRDIAVSIDSWTSLTKNWWIWVYATNFTNYLTPYNALSTLQNNYKILLNTGAQMKWLFNQAQFDQLNPTGFVYLHAYIDAKLRWNVNQDINELIENFMSNFFKDASETMNLLHNQMRMNFEHINEADFQGNLYYNPTSELYSHTTLMQWEGLINQAYEDIAHYKNTNMELYETLYNRINLESIAIRYLKIQLYGSYYSDADLLRVKNQFKADCLKLNVNKIKERVSIDTLWTSWGI